MWSASKPLSSSVFVAVVFALLTFGGIVCAEPPKASVTKTSALSWVRLPGAESCITTPELGSRIEAHLGRPALVSPSVADVSIEARIAKTGDGRAARYRAIVGGTRRDGTPIGTREIASETSDCRALDDGLVLVIALMIDPDALAPARPPPPSPPSPPSDPVVTREVVVHERVILRDIEREAAPKRPWIVQGALTGAAAFERLPGVAPGFGVSLRSGPSSLLAFEFSFGMYPSQTLEVRGRSVDFALIEGGVAFCPSVAFGSRVDLGGCAGLRFGEIRSRGRGFVNDKEVDRGLADVALGPRFMITVAGPVFALASASVLAPLVRQETRISNAGEPVILHRRSAIGGEVGIGAGIRFSP